MNYSNKQTNTNIKIIAKNSKIMHICFRNVAYVAFNCPIVNVISVSKNHADLWPIRDFVKRQVCPSRFTPHLPFSPSPLLPLPSYFPFAPFLSGICGRAPSGRKSFETALSPFWKYSAPAHGVEYRSEWLPKQATSRARMAFSYAEN